MGVYLASLGDSILRQVHHKQLYIQNRCHITLLNVLLQNLLVYKQMNGSLFLQIAHVLNLEHLGQSKALVFGLLIASQPLHF